MSYTVTPSRLDGLDADGRQGSNPFHYNGNSPSFFQLIHCDTREEAERVAAHIETRDKPGIWVAYIDEVDDEPDPGPLRTKSAQLVRERFPHLYREQ